MNIHVARGAPFPPCKCVVCGTCNSDYFVDTGILLELHFNPVIYNGPGFEGAIYLCREHWESLVREGCKKVAQFEEVELNKEINGSTISNPGTVEVGRSTVEDNRQVESNDHEPTDGDSESDSTGLDASIEEFSGFFGGPRAG